MSSMVPDPDNTLGRVTSEAEASGQIWKARALEVLLFCLPRRSLAGKLAGTLVLQFTKVS